MPPPCPLRSHARSRRLARCLAWMSDSRAAAHGRRPRSSLLVVLATPRARPAAARGRRSPCLELTQLPRLELALPPLTRAGVAQLTGPPPMAVARPRGVGRTPSVVFSGTRAVLVFPNMLRIFLKWDVLVPLDSQPNSSRRRSIPSHPI